MFNKNVFTQKDPIADIIKGINEADYKAKMEELKGNQHKIDKNKNNKIDAHDFKILRGEKKAMKEEDSLDEATMTHITLGNKVKNSDGGHNQDVHYKGKKIGSIESYKHRTGLRYGAKHDASGDMEAGSRSPEEAVDFVRAAHADHLKSVKKESVEESNNPFDYKNYKSQLPTKPGEKAGFDSKKISTGTVYSRKPVKDEPMKKESAPAGANVRGSTSSISKAATQGIGSTRHANNALMEKGKEIKKEEIDPDDTTTDTLKGREKTSANPFLSKKVKMDVPDNVKEEHEQVYEAQFNPLKHIKNPSPAVKAAAKDVKRGSYADRAALMKAGGVKDDRGPRGVTQEESEQIDELKKSTVKSYMNKKVDRIHKDADLQYPFKPIPITKKEVEKNTKDLMRGHARLSGVKPTSEEVEQIDEFYDEGPEMTHHKLVDGKPNVPKKVGSKDIHLHHIGTGNPTGENAKYKVVAVGSRSPLKAKVGSTITGRHVNDHMDDGVGGGRVHIHTARPKSHFMDEEVVKEDVEQIDELSKDTLTSYATKAGKSLGGAVATIGNAKRISKFYAQKTSPKEVKNDAIHRAGKRMFGLGRAASRLTKEEVEQMDERTLTKGETAEKERIVKGMKKSLAGFKARYGDKAKSVMYATATKAAKKD